MTDIGRKLAIPILLTFILFGILSASTDVRGTDQGDFFSSPPDNVMTNLTCEKTIYTLGEDIKLTLTLSCTDNGGAYLWNSDSMFLHWNVYEYTRGFIGSYPKGYALMVITDAVIPPNQTLSYEINLYPISDSGQYTVVATAYNIPGSAAVSFLVNAPPDPSFTINYPSHYLDESGNLNITVNASATTDDFDLIDDMQARWDWNNDTIWDTPWEEANIAISKSVHFADQGRYPIKMEIIDSYGMKNQTVKWIDVLIDKQAPESSAMPYGNNVLIVASDSGSGIDDTFYRIDNGSWELYDYPFVVSGPGNHTVEYYSIDNVGNKETISSIWVTNEIEERTDGIDAGAIAPNFEKTMGAAGFPNTTYLAIISVMAAVISVSSLILQRKK